MRINLGFCVSAVLIAGPALADPSGSRGMNPTAAEIRSGAVIDDGLDIPHIRAGTQYFEIHGSTRIARALGGFRLPTDDAGLLQMDEQTSTTHVAAW